MVGIDRAADARVARTVDSTIDGREGNAMSLRVSASEQFTILTCHQRLQFIPDKPTAIREMRRVVARPVSRTFTTCYARRQRA
jgi:ubiquinone/menaquinone biosynthesis C-methylase UbiE